MQMDYLIQSIVRSGAGFIASVKAGEAMPILGLRRSARLPVLAALHQETNRPILLLTDRTDRAMTLVDELALWMPKAHRLFFPEPSTLFYENASWGETIRRERLLTLTTLATYHHPSAPKPSSPPVIIAPIRAVMTRSMPRRDFLKSFRILRAKNGTQGQNHLAIQPEKLAHDLIAMGYEPVNTVIAPGQFARRGGIFDIWAPADEQPTRLEFFGDEIETLRQFDPATQRTTRLVEQVLISPAREYLLPGEAFHLPSQDQICEFHIPLLHPFAVGLLEYLPHHVLVLIDNWEDLQDTVNEIEEKAVQLRQGFIAEGTLSHEFPIPYLSWSEIEDLLAPYQVLRLGPVAIPEETEIAKRFIAGPRFGGRLKLLLDHLTQIHASAEPFIVVSRQASRLKELWMEQQPSRSQDLAQACFLEGSLSEGWTFLAEEAGEGLRIHLLTDGEIFGWKRPEPRQRRHGIVEAPEAAYADLQAGDWVVHVDHGIGRFLGLVNRSVDGIEREYLLVEYAEGDQLFVPVYQADRISRYIGPDSRIPSPNRLGSIEWRGTKSRVKEAVKEIAEDLLDLYARRQVVTGHAFAPDSPWQQELEASFPYIETEDQLRVIAEVKRDMESTRPMDRLICGDVGYGKTEVALRAAFKAVMDGKQVAMLVPTTVLAQQHYNTFRQRLAAFPVEVEMLSRFRTPQQQREILTRLELGSIDMVIGTHRLLQDDVKFKDLGLLIIDEEQRFGVTHKEFLKRMRTEVDVLTLTATPIPRTLYLALTGVRDISTINTPPEERLPVITHVGPYSSWLVRQAILRELERGGQVFFVHNRVQTISAMYSHLKRLVPEARIAIAHGQMLEEELSQRMEQFTAGEIDVLLTTSIIESGLDIPNANTLIVDRADTFGLAQLYQLRGRVGRGAQRAYAYFFKHRRKSPTPEARQRLETIAENTQLGAGFSIAMRDLEIRGAGEILGTRQHGHIAAVGFHLYTRMLAEAVTHLRTARGLPSEPLAMTEAHRPLVSVDLPIPIGIPTDYIPDKNMRLRLYRRLADLQKISEVDALAMEFQDRFGALPEMVSNLFYQLKIKLYAEAAGLSAITPENGQLALRFPEDIPQHELPDLGDLVRVGKFALWLSYNGQVNWRETLVQVLQRLCSHRESSMVSISQAAS